MRSLPIAVLVLLVSTSDTFATLKVIRGGKPSPFSHTAHQQHEAGPCASCHQTSGNEVRPPGHASCLDAGCHADAFAGLNASASSASASDKVCQSCHVKVDRQTLPAERLPDVRPLEPSVWRTTTPLLRIVAAGVVTFAAIELVLAALAWRFPRRRRRKPRAGTIGLALGAAAASFVVALASAVFPAPEPDPVLRPPRTPALATPVASRFIGIAIDRYQQLPQQFAVSDTKAVGEALAKRGRLQSTLLTDGSVNRDAVVAALQSLSAMAPDEVAVVVFSGYSARQSGGAPRFITNDKDLSTATGIAWSDIAAALAAARGRVLVLLDATETEQKDDAIARVLQRPNTVVLANASPGQISYESDVTRNGLFMGVVLRTLGDPTSDTNQDGKVSVRELAAAVTAFVNAGSNGSQTPVLGEVSDDFAIAATPPVRLPSKNPPPPRRTEFGGNLKSR